MQAINKKMQIKENILIFLELTGIHESENSYL